MSTPTTEFTGFTPEQRKLIALLHESDYIDLETGKPYPYFPDQLIASGVMGPDNREMNALIEWGLVEIGETVYDESPDTGYALTDAGKQIAQHLARETSVPEYAHAGWQAALQIEMDRIIADTQASRAKAVKEAETQRRFITTFKAILERIGVKDANPTGRRYIHQGEVEFILSQLSFSRDWSNTKGTWVEDEKRIRYDLAVRRPMNDAEQALFDEMDACNKRDGRMYNSDFRDRHGDFSRYIRQYPLHAYLQSHNESEFISLDNATSGVWGKQARRFADFVLNAQANWESLQIEWARYQETFQMWQTEQEEARREAERLAAEEAAGVTEITDPGEMVINPNESWADDAGWLTNLLERINRGDLLDETDLWILSTVKIARRLDSAHYRRLDSAHYRYDEF